ncbi:hypothetical protein [Rugamonas sp. DEMB1]|uniref:hypothetical protein n=1 Tax=Rugamonas sp. DEMB1 TaxID=3039386 RepID=UPI0024498C4C|nr:hypothetical protein [Rugamonas sp. DEMB1]WGG51146.1 hypothetical protein QC826_02320 [Rugamonas sp. DEMB1]
MRIIAGVSRMMMMPVRSSVTRSRALSRVFNEKATVLTSPLVRKKLRTSSCW